MSAMLTAETYDVVSIQDLMSSEIDYVAGGTYSHNNCVTMTTAVGAIIGACFGAGLGAAIGAIAGTWYGEEVCRPDDK